MNPPEIPHSGNPGPAPLLLATMLLALMAGPATAQESAAVEVFVFGAETGLPLEGAAVCVAETCGTSDAGGLVVLSVPEGELPVTIGGFDVGLVSTAPGRTSEMLVTLGADRATVTAIEAPDVSEEPEVAQEVEDAGPPGRIAGRIVNGETGEPLAAARLYVRGLDVDILTGSDGAFSIEAPVGDWDLSVVRVGFTTYAQTGIAVASEATTELTIEMLPAAPSLDDFVVRAPRIEGGTSSLLLERQESAAVSDVLGAEQMSASGDSDAAGALKRVPGLTVVGGKYVYVRGLGERYSATLMNGANLPSPEPERRVVPLDLFPTAVLESVVIQKTFSPDMPAEFGGGVIALRTRSIAEEPVAKLKLSTGFTTGVQFQKRLTYDGGPTDGLGIDGGFRKLPELVRAASDGEPLEEADMFSDRGYEPSELEAFGEAMPNRWNLSRADTPPNLGLGATFGHGVRKDGKHLGFLLGLGYGVSHDLDRFDRIYTLLGEGGALEESHTYNFETGKRSVRLGGILAVGFAPHATQQFNITTLLARKTDDEARTYEGLNRDVGDLIRVSRLRFVERMLLTQQFRGQHVIEPLKGLTIDWRYTWSMASRDEPDRREYRYDNENGTDVWLLSDRPEGNQRFFSTLGDRGHDVGIDVTMPFTLREEDTARIKVGGGFMNKQRSVDTRRFKFMHKGVNTGDPEIISQDPESVFTPENIGDGGFQFEEVTRQTDNYSAGQTIGNVYALADVPILPWLRIMGGVRLERSVQEVSTFELFNPDGEPVLADLKTTDVLPALTVTFEPRPGMLARIGYGLTLSRPDFRELSPATFNDVTGGRQTFGNPELERAQIHNVDARWEWYPTSSESVSAGVFYKHFVKPIEQIVVVSAQHSVSWANAETADNIGFELDWRKDFGFIHDALADLYFAGNVAVVYSQVRLGENSGIQSSDKRALQGQSPVVINLQLGYDNPISGTRLNLLYNVFGRRIGEVGALGAPDSYEESFHQLDFVASQRIGTSGVKLGFKVKNLLNPFERYTQGDFEVERNRRGISFGLSVDWDMTALANIRPERKGQPQ